MAIFDGILNKMQLTPSDQVAYTLRDKGQSLTLNPYLGKKLKLSFKGDIFCISCGRKSKKSFQQGYCYPCTIKLASCDLCMVRPEKCHYHLGTCREPEWGLKECFQDHYVYLANSSGLKVGITRASQLPTRWLDQGASQAQPILKVENRLHSGLVEIVLTEHFADKTHWQKLLKSDAPKLDFTSSVAKIYEVIENIKDIKIEKCELPLREFSYPILRYPEKVKSVNFEKVAELTGTLIGMKGQYLMFDDGVINIRSHQGFSVTIEESP
jgi:hypothetical protein